MEGQRLQPQTQDVRSCTYFLDFLTKRKTFSCSSQHARAWQQIHIGSTGAHRFSPRSTVLTSLMKVLNQIIYFLSLQSSCLKRNTGPEQRLPWICCLRIPFSSGWLWVHASRTSQNKDHMCLFNVNQTRGCKSPTSCPTATSKRVEGYAECLWGWKDVGAGGVSGFQGINSNALDFFCITLSDPWQTSPQQKGPNGGGKAGGEIKTSCS